MDIHYSWQPDLAALPRSPGVYRFHDVQGRVLYIGKALNLRRRIASYAQPRRQPPKIRRMLRRVRTLTLQQTGSELEALLWESRLIKQERPPCNQLLTAYAAPPLVKLTLGETFPRLLVTRQFVADGSQYLGPFPDLAIAALVCAALQRLFPLRTCDSAILPGVSPVPCEAFHLRKCVAPCLGAAGVASYGPHVEALMALLSHGSGAVVQRLREERQRAMEALLFERAGHVHSLLAALEDATVGRPLSLMPVALRNIVVIVIPTLGHVQELICVRQGRFAGHLSLAETSMGWPALQGLLTRCYLSPAPATVDGEMLVDELRIVTSWLHRTRPRTRWIHVGVDSQPAEVLRAVWRVMSRAPLPVTLTTGTQET